MRKIPSILLIAFMALLAACETPAKVEFATTSLLDSAMEKSVEVVKKEISTTISTEKSGTFYGIDISHYQGDIITRLSTTDSIHFVFCKATQGQYYVDPDFRTNWKEAKEYKLIRGTYHFYDCRVAPETQATHFFNTVEQLEKTDIAPVLDIEAGSMHPTVSAEQMVKDIQVFLDLTEKKFGRKPLLYTNYAFAQEYFKNTDLSKYDLWLAEYSKHAEPKVPDLWKDKGYLIWQKSANYHDHSTQLDFDEYQGILTNLTQ